MKKNNIINVIIIIVFLGISLLIGINHEPWADEAQSWIIARDASVSEIIWDIARYEGAFPLWHLTLKLFINFGLTYEYLYIVPIIISLIGLIVFLKKVEVPTYVKILLPFTYYIFYQYTIIARSYCYLLLAFSLLLITYKNRLEKPLKYILSLAFLSLISMHGMIIACGFVLLLFIEIIKLKKIKQYIKNFIIFGIVTVLEIIVLFPSSDLYMTVAAAYTIPEIMMSLLGIVSGNGNLFLKIYNVVAFLLLVFLFIKVCLLKNKDVPIVTGIVFFFMFIIRFACHHGGIIFFLIIFGVIAYYDEIKKQAKYIDKIFMAVLILYSILSIQAGINDITQKYSGAEEMATYIQENKYHEKKIFGFGFKDVSLQPYFEENLYKNMDEAIYRWSINNKDFYIYCNLEDYKSSDFTEVPEYIVLEWDDTDVRVKLIEKIIENTGKYEIEYRTMGYEFFKNSYSEYEGYTLYKLKE